MNRLFHKLGEFLHLVLRLIHLGNEIQRDTDFLGYEAFSRMNTEGLRPTAPAKQHSHTR